MDDAPDATAPGPVTVWFDGDCPLCAREIGLMRRLDRSGAVTFIDLCDGAPAPLATPVMLRRLHAREAGGAVVSGAEAFAALWRAIPALRPLGRAARFKPVLWLLEQGYGAFLIVRPVLQVLVRRMDASSRRHGAADGR